MNAKRIICLLLAILMGVGVLAGCGLASANSATASSGANSAAASTFDYSKGLTEDGYFEGVKALDYVTLKDYKGVSIPAETSVASDEDVQSQIDSLLAKYTTNEKLTDRAVADGDTINIDYVGSIDGEEFKGGSTGGAGSTVTIGTTNFIDDFLEQLIGHKPGETFDIEVTFPDPYTANADLAGKDAVFNVTINYIQGDEIVPEFNDDFVATNLSDYGFASAEDARKEIATSIIQNQEYTYLWETMQAGTQVSEVPQSVLDYTSALLVQSYTSTAAQYSLDLATYLSYMGYATTDDLLADSAEQIEASAKEMLIAQAIAETEAIKVEDDDIKDYFGLDDLSDYSDYYGRPFLTLYAMRNQVDELMMDSAVRV